MTSTSALGGAPPEFDLADRMRKALRTSGVSVQDMADYLGVARNTVSTWINGKITPSVQTQRLWALRTGTPYEWIHDGEESAARSTGSSGPNVYALRDIPATVAPSVARGVRAA